MDSVIPIIKINKERGMIMKKILCLAMVLCVSVFFLISCSGGKNAAELAIKAAEEAVNATKAEAAKVVPEEVKSLEDTLTAVKGKFTNGEYKAAMEEATTLAAKAKDVLAAAKVKKEELTKKWTEIGQGLPKMVEDIQAKVDSLSKVKKLPAKITKEGFEEAKAGLASIKDEWAKAQASFTSGNFTEAVSVATSLKDKAVKIMESLGMSVPVAEAPATAPAPAATPAPAPAAAK
jgi:nucleotide-binding universal stress UspA family protein